MSEFFTDKRMTKTCKAAYAAIHKGTKGNGREMASCVATLFVGTMRLLNIPPDTAIDALKATYDAIEASNRPMQ
jgi:hypothetical protein